MQYVSKHGKHNITIAGDSVREVNDIISMLNIEGPWYHHEEYNVFEEIGNFLRRINTPNVRIAMKIIQIILLGLIAIALLI